MEISLQGTSVCIGIPSTRDIHPFVVKSLFGTKGLCDRVGVPCSLAIVSGNAVIQWARDEVLHLMLQTDANRFFFIDSDIIWEPEDFMRLLALSQLRDVVCASYTAKKDQPTFYIRYDNSKPLSADEYGLIEIKGAGLGFTVMKREAVEAVSEKAPKVKDEITGTEYPSVFSVGMVNGCRRGEDMAFFESINDLGYKIHMDPTISLGHVGTKIYRGKAADAMVINEE